MIAWPGSLVISSPAYVIALELAPCQCQWHAISVLVAAITILHRIAIIITQDYAAAKSFSVLGDIFRTMVAAMVKW